MLPKDAELILAKVVPPFIENCHVPSLVLFNAVIPMPWLPTSRKLTSPSLRKVDTAVPVLAVANVFDNSCK